MFITNLTNDRLGVDGLINLAPREVNRYIDDKNKDLVARVVLLEAAKLISVVRKPGLTKTGIPGNVVKTIGADKAALTSAPRTEGVKAPVTPASTIKAPADVELPKEEVQPLEVPAEEVKEDVKAEEVIPEAAPEVVPEKPAKRTSRKTKVMEAVAKATEA